MGANKLHTGLIWVIYSRNLGSGLGTFLYPWPEGETDHKQVKSSEGSTSLILSEPQGTSSHKDVVVKETQPGHKEIN